MKIKTTPFLSTIFFVTTFFTAHAQVDNTFTGENSGTNNTGSFSTGYGVSSLLNNANNSNNAFGVKALMNSTGGFNCAFGNEALALNGSGTLNCSIGVRSLFNNVSGSGNIAFGHRALEANRTGDYNTALGYFSLSTNIGYRNTAVGYYSPRNLVSGDDNIFIGSETAMNLLHGNYNVFLGNRITLEKLPSTPLLAGNDTGKSIIIADGMGNQRIFVNKSGNTGIGLGNNVIPVNKLDVKGGMAIGKGFTPNGITPGVTAPANGLMVEGKVGIGTMTPNNKLEITSGSNGSSGLRFTNLSSNYSPAIPHVSNRFLTVNQSGDVVLDALPNNTTTNILTSTANTMTSNVNGVAASAPIVNSISNTLTNHQLTTTVNGVIGAPVNIDTQTLSITGNTLTIANGNSVALPVYVDEPQVLTQVGSTVTLSDGGGSFVLPSTTVTAGTNVTVTGNGAAATPYVVNAIDTSLYANNGTINSATTTAGNRIVNMNNQNIWFSSNAADANGKIYIGANSSYPTTTGNYKLFVEGGVLTEKVKVALRSTANWADYVFEKDYKVMPIKEVETFIDTNKHLPGIDSAAELSKNGLDLAEMQSKQMAKIEEMMLYIIQQNKIIEENTKEIKSLKKEVADLKAQQN